MAFTVADFFVSLGFNLDSNSQATAERGYAKFEKAVRDAEARIEKAKAEGAKASVRYALEIEAAQAREALEAAKSAAKVVEAEKQKAKASAEASRQIVASQTQWSRETANATAFAIVKLEAFVAAAEAVARGVASAIGNVATSYKDLHFEAERVGGTVSGLQALAYAFEQVGGKAMQVVGAVDSFATSLNNPGLKQFVANLGVDMKAPAESQFLQTIEALHKKNDYNLEHQQAEMLGIPEPVYKRAIQQMDELKRRQAERAATIRAMGLNEDEAGNASARLLQSLGSLSMTISVAFDRLITDHFPRLNRWLEGLNEWIKSNQVQIRAAVDFIGDKIEEFGRKAEDAFKRFSEYMGSDEGKKDLTDFATRIERIAGNALKLALALERIVNGSAAVIRFFERMSGTSTALGSPDRTIAALNEISGGTAAPDGPGGIDATPVERKPDKRTWWQRHAPKAIGGLDDPNAPADQRGGLRARATRALRGDQSGGVAANPGAYKDVLDHIARSEGTATRQGGGYNTSLDLGRWLPGGKEQDLTKLTLDQIDELQKGMLANPENRARYGNGLGSSAIGRYQIVRRTLNGLRRQLNLKGDQLFDAGMQDRLGATLARSRGADPVGLQQEWASLVGAKNATAVALMQKVDPKASTLPIGPAPKVDVRVTAPSVPVTPKQIPIPDYLHGPGGFDVNALTRPSAPLGTNSSPAVSNSATDNRSVTNNFHSDIKVQGSNDPQMHARVIQSSLERGYNDVMENTQSVLRG